MGGRPAPVPGGQGVGRLHLPEGLQALGGKLVVGEVSARGAGVHRHYKEVFRQPSKSRWVAFKDMLEIWQLNGCFLFIT